MSDDLSTTTDLRQLNRNRVYRIIHKSGQLSKQEIARLLGLSLPTVDQNLKELIAEGFVKLEGTFGSTGGRKANAIAVVSGARCAVGLEITSQRIKCVAVNLSGEVLAYDEVKREFSSDEEYFSALGSTVDKFVENNAITAELVLGVGVSVPGVLDAGSEVITAVSLGVNGILVENFVRDINYPCLAINDANAGGFAELWENENHDCMVYLSVVNGIGGAVLFNQALYTGGEGLAGEFGHMTIVPNGRECDCGKCGCFEAYCSIARLSTDLGITLEEFFEALPQNPEYGKIWDEYLGYLVIAISNLNMILDCPIILGGALTPFLGAFLPEIHERLAEMSPFGGDKNYFSLSRYGTKANCIGAALRFVSGFIEKI